MSNTRLSKTQARAIGILGGTFDPIHFGHIKPAAQILDLLGLAQIKLLPSHIPPHKGAPGVNSKQRAAMVKLACEGLNGFSIDLQELTRDEPSYTAVTLKNIKQQNPYTPICFLMGMDSLLSFKQWYQWPLILKLCHLVVSYRPGWQLGNDSEINDLLMQHQTDDINQLHHTQAGLIYLAPIEPLNISSTQIRNLVKQGSNTDELLPANVRQYIDDCGLYL